MDTMLLSSSLIYLMVICCHQYNNGH